MNLPATVLIPEGEAWVSFELTALDDTETVSIVALLPDETPSSPATEVTVSIPGDGPYVEIVSPADGDEVFSHGTEVVATIQGEGDIDWLLEQRLADGDDGDLVEICTGTGSFTIEAMPEACDLDPTLMLNGPHVLRLSAEDDNGTFYHEVILVVKGQQKLGQFSVSFVDMTIPLAGLPIQVIRTYDSRDTRIGDFGLGWRISTSDVRLEVNRVIGEEWDEVEYGDPGQWGVTQKCAEETLRHVVTVTFPDGRVEQFRPDFWLNEGHAGSCQWNDIGLGWLRFVPVGNTRSKLEVLELSQGGDPDLSEATLDESSGVVLAGQDDPEFEYDPTIYRLTTQDGTMYEFERVDADPRQIFTLVSIADRNGNTLTFDGNGIHQEPSGKEVVFNRNGDGLIESIEDPGENDAHYAYVDLLDGGGEVWALEKYWDRMHDPPSGAHAEFDYISSPRYLLEKINDALGQRASWSGYDSDGRLNRVCDAGAVDLDDDDHCIDLAEPDWGANTQVITDRRGGQTILHFDPHGNVLTRTDALDNAWASEYTDDDQVELETDPLLNTTRTTYDAHGHVAGVEKSEYGVGVLSTTCFRWTEDGDLLATWQDCDIDDVDALDVEDATSRSTFDHHGNLIATEDALGHGTTIVPGVYGNPETITDALQNVTHQTWVGALLMDETDASGAMTFYDYVDPATQEEDANGNAHLVTRFAADGTFLSETLSEFDLDGRQTRSVAADGSITETVYDDAGRRWKSRALVGLGEDPHDPEDDVYRETVTYFDDVGQVLWTRYADDTYTETLRDESGNEIWRRSRTRYTSWHPTNGPVRDTTDLSIVTQTAFDGLDRPVKTCVGDGANLLNPPDEWALGCTWTEYDPAGRVKWSRDERGAVRITDFDGMGRAIVSCGPFFPEETLELDDDLACADVEDLPVATTHHDEQGRVDWTQDELGVYAVTLFDAAGRRRAECSTNDLELVPENPNPPLETGDPDNDIACSLFEMDASGRVIAQEDRNGIRTEYGFDELGRLVAVTDALEQVTSYGFDDSGNMTEQHDAKERVTHFEFDEMGRRTARVLPLGQRETFAHAISGAMASRVDFMGRTTARVTDPESGRVTSVDFANDPTVTTTYFSDGQRETVTIADGEIVTYHRDPTRGLLSRVDHSEGTDIAYSRDRAGNRNAITTDPGGSTERTITYDHDAAGRVARVWDGFKRAEPLDEEETPTCDVDAPDECSIVDYSFDDAGRLATLTYRNASGTAKVIGTYVHHAVTGSLASIEWRTASPDALLLRLEYVRDEAGRRTGVTETWSDRTRDVEWGFDLLYRLTRETVEDSDGPDWETTFEYDEVGNRLVRERTGDAPETVASTYDDNDRILTAGTTSFEWSANGNLELEDLNGDITDYVWDDQDRLVQAVTSDEVELGFVYDADGIKQSATVDSAVTRYVVDGTFPYAQVLEERTNAGALIARYARGAQILRQYRVGDGHAWYLHDALGSTRALAAIGGGSLTDEWDFEAFGEQARREGESENAWLFAGEERHAQIDLDYLRARWMQPRGAGFLTIDPADRPREQPWRSPVYGYAAADPGNATDPSGESISGLTMGVMVVGSFAIVSLGTFVVLEHLQGVSHEAWKSIGPRRHTGLVVFNPLGQDPGSYRHASAVAALLTPDGWDVEYRKWKGDAPLPVSGHFTAIFYLGHHSAVQGGSLDLAQALSAKGVHTDHFVTGECPSGGSDHAQRQLMRIHATGIADHEWGFGESCPYPDDWPSLPALAWGPSREPPSPPHEGPQPFIDPHLQ